jgi:hypothetical protein
MNKNLVVNSSLDPASIPSWSLFGRSKIEQQKYDAQTQAVIDFFKSGNLPTPDYIIKILSYRVGEDRYTLMRHHQFWEENTLRNGLWELIASAEAAHLDLRRCEAALTAYASRRKPYQDHVDHTVVNPAQKEILAFCAACHGTIDTLRRIKERRSDLLASIEAIVSEVATSEAFTFIKYLRRNLSHGSVIMPSYMVSSSASKGTSGRIKFTSKILLSFGEWPVAVQNFLKIEDNLLISEVTLKCLKHLSKMRNDLENLFFTNRSHAEKDYFDIMDLISRQTSAQFMKIMLHPHVEKETNPYDYLNRFLKEKELRQVLRKPANSKEQVDFIISLYSAKVECDDELRQMLYKLFKVI